MSEARPEDKRDIDAILASIRAELGTTTVVREEPVARQRQLSVVRVPAIEEQEEPFPTNRQTISAEEFEGLDEQAFLHAAYRVVLGRDIDESGFNHYLPKLRSGAITPIELLRLLTASPEGKARGVTVTNLESRGWAAKLANVPVIGGLVAQLRRFMLLPHNDRRFHKRILAADRRHRDLVDSLNVALASIKRSMQQLEERIAEADYNAGQAVDFARQAIDGRDAALAETAAARRQVTVQSQILADLIERAKVPETAVAIPPAAATALEDASLDSLYVAFENRFRGSTAAISERLKRYLDLFRISEPVAAGGTVLDVGCGRGEWLALLRDNNIAARGVDLNGAMAAEARSKDLEVEEGDAIAHMRALPGESLAAVTGFHIVEHLPFRDLVAMFDAAHRALSPGGFVLFETPNPENLVVGACTFNLDPTHNRPLPPDFLRFVAEARGFEDVRIIRKDEDCDPTQPESSTGPVEINDWFLAPQDYAVYARKAAAAG